MHSDIVKRGKFWGWSQQKYQRFDSPKIITLCMYCDNPLQKFQKFKAKAFFVWISKKILSFLEGFRSSRSKKIKKKMSYPYQPFLLATAVLIILAAYQWQNIFFSNVISTDLVNGGYAHRLAPNLEGEKIKRKHFK